MDRLEDLLRERLRVPDVRALVALAEETAIALGFQEASPNEEAADRFFDPGFYDAFAMAVIDSAVNDDLKARVADLAFDLVQLPGTEREAFAVTQAIPPHLPRFAAFLAGAGRGTSQHLLELVYGLYLRAFPAAALAEAGAGPLFEVSRIPDATDSHRQLYALLLATYPGLGDATAIALFLTFARSDLDVTLRFRIARSLESEADLQRNLGDTVRSNDLGEVDFTAFRYALPKALQEAAVRWRLSMHRV